VTQHVLLYCTSSTTQTPMRKFTQCSKKDDIRLITVKVRSHQMRCIASHWLLQFSLQWVCSHSCHCFE